MADKFMKIKDVEWNIPSQDRNYYLDLESLMILWSLHHNITIK
jgi:hypothetical protein